LFFLNEIFPKNGTTLPADMPNKPLPPLHPGTHQPIGPEALAPLFPMELIKQEVSSDPWVEIPEEVREISTKSGARPPLPRPLAGKNARHPCQNLLQV
jgi:predicted alternative tryptophan synthase beta-subunit